MPDEAVTAVATEIDRKGGKMKEDGMSDRNVNEYCALVRVSLSSFIGGPGLRLIFDMYHVEPARHVVPRGYRPKDRQTDPRECRLNRHRSKNTNPFLLYDTCYTWSIARLHYKKLKVI